MEITLNQENFEKEALRSPLPIIVDFWAEWCGPCHAIAPALREIAKDYEGRLVVGKLNVDENPEVAEKYHIRSIPNLKIFKNGQSQAVRLPKEFRFEDDYVFVKKSGNVIILIPAKNSWASLLNSLTKFSDDFMTERKQPKTQVREYF